MLVESDFFDEFERNKEKPMIANTIERAGYKQDSRIFWLVREHDARGKCANGAIGAEVAQLAHSGVKGKVKRSSEITAMKVGTSARIVERVRTILDRGDTELVQRLEAGQVSINAAYREVVDHRDSQPPLSIYEVFTHFLGMVVPSEHRVQVLGENELVLLGDFSEKLWEQGYLSETEAMMLHERIARKLGRDFGGLLNGKSGK